MGVCVCLGERVAGPQSEQEHRADLAWIQHTRQHEVGKAAESASIAPNSAPEVIVRRACEIGTESTKVIRVALGQSAQKENTPCVGKASLPVSSRLYTAGRAPRLS